MSFHVIKKNDKRVVALLAVAIVVGTVQTSIISSITNQDMTRRQKNDVAGVSTTISLAMRQHDNHAGAIINKSSFSSTFHIQHNKKKTSSSTTSATTTTTKKPSLIIHIGPSKTATTTLQNDFRSFWKQLPKDNYAYVGKDHVKGDIAFLYNAFQGNEVFRCLSNYVKNLFISTNATMNTTMMTTMTTTLSDVTNATVAAHSCWGRMMRRLDELRATNKSILISEEGMSHGSKRWMYQKNGPACIQLFSSELQKRWNVTVVIGYRRYAEWVLSALKEDNAKRVSYPRSRTKGWPHQKGVPPRDPWSVIQKWVESNKVSEIYNYLFTDQSVPIWRLGSFNTAVLNIHDIGDDRDITSHFFCSLLWDTPQICQHALSRRQIQRSNFRTVSNDIYNGIVFEAARLGVLNDNETAKMTRQKAASELQEYHEKLLGLSWIDLPLVCPSGTEMEWFLNVSLTKEKEVVPDFFRREESNHRAKFWRLANERKEFCRIDREMLFQNKTTWKQVLESLNETARDGGIPNNP